MYKKKARMGTMKEVHDDGGPLEFLSSVVRLRLGRKGEER